MRKFPSFCQAIGEASKRLKGQGTWRVVAQGKECPSGFPRWARLMHSIRQLEAYTHAHAHAHDRETPYIRTGGGLGVSDLGEVHEGGT